MRDACLAHKWQPSCRVSTPLPDPDPDRFRPNALVCETPSVHVGGFSMEMAGHSAWALLSDGTWRVQAESASLAADLNTRCGAPLGETLQGPGQPGPVITRGQSQVT